MGKNGHLCVHSLYHLLTNTFLDFKAQQEKTKYVTEHNEQELN